MSELEKLVAQPLQLAEEISYAEGGIVSKTLLDEKAGTLTLFALSEGQNISEHSAPHYALAQVLEGEGLFVINDKPLKVAAGQSIFMPPDIPHAVRAPADFKMLLTMIKD